MNLWMLGLALTQIAADLPVRVPMGEVALPTPKTIDHVIVMRVDFAPGQGMPRHVHPAPVVCVVEHGRFNAQIGDAAPHDYGEGEVTLEPANVAVGWFRNLSVTQPASLICTFLAGAGDHELSRMLPAQ